MEEDGGIRKSCLMRIRLLRVHVVLLLGYFSRIIDTILFLTTLLNDSSYQTDVQLCGVS
ncbi:hypothetical protein BDV24DRAFT_134604 [Aspergillus arachidicola]|uniref:Uncharacterized protein n=1 Tax=Aspergillus arachidicola TaxID=656916 RepID=A0A5N6Y3P3_9EURO|nr:hypothetical protein BDV24DRAFT_134604 [Aspergillus arachidicola]